MTDYDRYELGIDDDDRIALCSRGEDGEFVRSFFHQEDGPSIADLMAAADAHAAKRPGPAGRRLHAVGDGEAPGCACGAPGALAVGYHGETASVFQCVRCATVDPRVPFFHRKLNNALEWP